MANFSERMAAAGVEEYKSGCFKYVDDISVVCYKKVTTSDQDNIPFYAVFTACKPHEPLRFAGFVSEYYNFIGNRVLINKIKESVQETGTVVLKEATAFNSRKTSMIHEIVVSSGSAQEGDILPEIAVQNSYDGTWQAKVLFGLCVAGTKLVFRTKLGSFSQVHSVASKSRLTGAIASYFVTFKENITELVSLNFKNKLTEDDVLRTLELVERIGKKKRQVVSEYLAEMSGPVTAWNMFLAITKFSSTEKNINTRILLENIAERVLVLPQKMLNLCEEEETQ